VNDLIIFVLIELFSEDDIIANSIINDPWLLACIRQSAVDYNWRNSFLIFHLTKQAINKWTFSTTISANDCNEFTPFDLKVDIFKLNV